MYEVAKGTPVIGHGIAAGHAFAGKVENVLKGSLVKIQIMGGKVC